MTTFQNKAISASAGSGKTFRLAHRYMGLLARGVAPDRIWALTFSRKAAGEIFDSIMRYLTRAAQNNKKAELSCKYMEAGAVSPEKFLALLRCFVENLHKANLGTIDGFIVGIIRAFPIELGLSGADFKLMDNDSADAESFQEDIIAAVCNADSPGKTRVNTFLESFRQATFGAAKKTFADSLKNFLANYRDAYLRLPAANSWGNPELIWENAPWWLKGPPIPAGQKDLEESLRIINGSVGWNKKMRDSLLKLLAELKDFNEGSEWEPDVFLDGRVQGQLVESFNTFKNGESRLTLEYANKTYPVPETIARTLRCLYHNLFHVQFGRMFKNSGGIFKIIDMYEKQYEQAVLRTGNLTFTDAQLMLSPHGFASGGITLGLSPDTKVSSPSTEIEGKIFMDYRLDSKIDHLLLDEFQDTSNLQWRTLENLADEILQDDGGTRSFFYVGDTKQTIYRWRGGNPDLFHSVLERYGKKIVNEPLNETQRSAQPIVDTVNRVFSNLPEKQNDGDTAALQNAAREKWASIWQKHKCGTLAPKCGYTALLRPPLAEGAKYHEDEDQFELLAKLLEQVRPMEKEISAAILVRKNSTGKNIADYLRRKSPDLNISYEGETALLDSPVVTLLLDLFRYAEHPADNFARQHIMMSPLGSRLTNNLPSPAPSAGGLDSLPQSILLETQAVGFKPVIRRWASRLGGLDAFGNLRLNQMLEIAGRFDARFDRNISLFIKTVETFGMREASEAEGSVHIMTIHQSKGLGFDMVILPDLNANERMNSSGAVEFLTGVSVDATPWLLTVPNRSTAECDATLKERLEERDALATLDNLCLLYVAMTRAKKALYMITKVQRQKHFNLAAFLEQRLSDAGNPPGTEQNSDKNQTNMLYEAGERNWFEGLEKPISPPKTEHIRAVLPPITAQKISLERIEPSLKENISMKASWLFNAESPEVLQFGSAIHELLSEVEWSDDRSPDEVIRNWEPEGNYPEAVLRDVRKQFRQALAEPEIKKALSRPAGSAELWREKAFDVVLDNKWISGIFDRVIILRDAAGEPSSAQIIDFKSDRTANQVKINELVKTYTPQLKLYRKALSFLLNLAEDRIETILLFTVPRRIVKLAC